MKILPAVAFMGLAALPFFGCQSLVRPQPEHDAAVASGIGNAIEFHDEALPDQDSSAVAAILTLQDAISRALRSDPGIQAALAKVRVAEAESLQTRLLPNPILTLAFRLPESGGQPIVDVSLAMELLSLLKKPGQVKAADFRLRAASSDAVVTVLDVLAEVRTKYSAIQAIDALMPVLKERQRLLDQTIGIAQARLNVREGIRLDVTTLEAQRAELEVEIFEQQTESRQLRLELSRLVGRPLDRTDWSVTPWTEPSGTLMDEMTWVRMALEHRPEIQNRAWELSALGIEAKLVQYAIFDGSEAGLDAERDGAWSVGPSVGIPLPIFDWGQGQQAKSQATILQTRHEITATRRKIMEEVRTTHLTYTSALETYQRVRDRLIPLLERRRSESEAQWRGGESDILSLIVAEQELQAGRTKLIELERKTAEAFIRLERAVGGPAFVPTAGTQPGTNVPTTQKE